MSLLSPYRGRRAILTTMHGKEQAVGPPLQSMLGLQLETSSGIDTDLLGTFTGEFPRAGGMLETAVHKARLGMERHGCAIGIASEGSFGPHPGFSFVPAGTEILVLVDQERDLVVHEMLLTTETNYTHATVAPDENIDAFLHEVGVPSHAVIVRPNEPGTAAPVAKGLSRIKDINRAIAEAAARSPDGRALIAPDMRAHLNPTRMRTLHLLAEKLATRVLTPCLACGSPGWGITGVERGLPCEYCGTPTQEVRADIWGCFACDYREIKPRHAAGLGASQASCNDCNP